MILTHVSCGHPVIMIPLDIDDTVTVAAWACMKCGPLVELKEILVKTEGHDAKRPRT